MTGSFREDLADDVTLEGVAIDGRIRHRPRPPHRRPCRSGMQSPSARGRPVVHLQARDAGPLDRSVSQQYRSVTGSAARTVSVNAEMRRRTFQKWSTN